MYLTFFSWLHQSYGFRGSTPQEICHFDTSHQVSVPSPWFTSVDVDLDQWVKCVSGCLIVDLLSLLSTLYFEESHYTQPILKERVVMFPLIRVVCFIIYLWFSCMGDYYSTPYTNLFTHLHQYEIMSIYTLDYNLKLLLGVLFSLGS